MDGLYITSYISKGAYFIKTQTDSPYTELYPLLKASGIEAYTLELRSVADNYEKVIARQLTMLRIFGTQSVFLLIGLFALIIFTASLYCENYKSWIAAIAAITACVLFAVNFRVTFVDGQSMEPTLKSHQLVLVKRTAASIQRDDIIVFRVDETVYIKRVVAVAGDTVQLKDSRVYINHVYLSPYTCDADIAAAYNLEADHYFVLGDNDGASIDSRDFGIISKEHIIGKVILF